MRVVMFIVGVMLPALALAQASYSGYQQQVAPSPYYQQPVASPYYQQPVASPYYQQAAPVAQAQPYQQPQPYAGQAGQIQGYGQPPVTNQQPVAPLIQAAAQEGWYISASTSYVMGGDHEFNYTAGTKISTELKDGVGLAGSAGYDFGKMFDPFGLRVEFEIAFRGNEVDKHTANGGATTGAKGDANSYAYMLNTFLDWHTGSMFRPYTGIGFGFATVEYDGYGVTGVPNVVSDEDTVLAYQLMLGTAFDLTDSFSITTDYRYFGTGDPDLKTGTGFGSETSYDTSNFTLGVRYLF